MLFFSERIKSARQSCTSPRNHILAPFTSSGGSGSLVIFGIAIIFGPLPLANSPIEVVQELSNGIEKTVLAEPS